MGKAERVGKSSDDIFLDKSLTTKVMAERRRKYLCLDQEVKDILAGNLGFCPSAPEHLKGWSKWKYLIWELVELSDKPSTVSLVVAAWILGLVEVSSVCAIVETLPTLRLEYIDLWKRLEYFFMFNFSIEFFLRIVSCPDKGVFLGVMLNWIDAVVVIPFWIEETIALTSGGGGMPNLTFVRLLRLGKVSLHHLIVPSESPSPCLTMPVTYSLLAGDSVGQTRAVQPWCADAERVTCEFN